MKRLLCSVMVLPLVAASCTGGGSSTHPASTRTSTVLSPQGPGLVVTGTLKVRLLSDVQYTFDPQQEYYNVTWELFRCCLLRTLLSYRGVAGERGTELAPDLASKPPAVSKDGLTWTFKIRPHIHYSPPLQNVTVTAQDFVRAIDREACVTCSANGYSFYYDVIRGFARAQAESSRASVHVRHRVAVPVSGVQALDDLTLQVRLVRPAGDLPYLFSMPATAPLPAIPGNPQPLLGIAAGHEENDGRFALVGTGPYMIEGTNRLDFHLPARKQPPVSGYTPGKSFVFVQNPSWDQSTDPLRQRNVKGMDFAIGGTEQEAAHAVDSGAADLCMDCPPLHNQIHGYLSNPRARNQVKVHPSDVVRFISMNLAEPPLDDVRVRRALNYAINRRAVGWLSPPFYPVGAAPVGSIATHIMPDDLERGLLSNYDPYATPGDRGSVAMAKREMAQSKYDRNRDGICDAKACGDIFLLTEEGRRANMQARVLERDLKPLGITLDVVACLPRCLGTNSHPPCIDPIEHTALCPNETWGKDFPDGSTFAIPLFASKSVGRGYNFSLVGASPALLSKDHYAVTHVPNVDPRINRCERIVGAGRAACWARFDRYMMEKVVPWVPLFFDDTVDVLGRHVGCYSFDQFAAEVALDHLCLTS